MAALSDIISCLCAGGRTPCKRDVLFSQAVVIEKPQPTSPLCFTSPKRSPSTDIVVEAISIIRSADKKSSALTRKVDDLVGAEGWTEWIAENILDGIVMALKEGREKMGPALAITYDEACKVAEVAFELAKDHPLVTAGLLTIIAVGVLVILTPTIVEVLGFAELGPLEGESPKSLFTRRSYIR